MTTLIRVKGIVCYADFCVWFMQTRWVS